MKTATHPGGGGVEGLLTLDDTCSANVTRVSALATPQSTPADVAAEVV